MLISVENTSLVIGFLTLLVNQGATLWRAEMRYHREQKERQQQDAKASKERRAMVRQLRNLRPDRHCAKIGCPLTVEPEPHPKRDNVRYFPPHTAQQ